MNRDLKLIIAAGIVAISIAGSVVGIGMGKADVSNAEWAGDFHCAANQVTHNGPIDMPVIAHPADFWDGGVLAWS